MDDILASVNYLNCLAYGIGNTDDIDHLGNRRLRCVGELLQNQFRIGFSRMERVIRERMTIQDLDMRHAPVSDQHPPCHRGDQGVLWLLPAEPVHGSDQPAGRADPQAPYLRSGPRRPEPRARVSFDVRDVHYSHYGRLCPIETPEGPNIGLISYLASYARVNEYGFIEAPYRKVDKATRIVTDEVRLHDRRCGGRVTSSLRPPSRMDENGCLANARVTCRHRDEIIEVDRDQVDYMDVSPQDDGVRGDRHDPLPGERRRKPCADGRKHAASGRASAGH